MTNWPNKELIHIIRGEIGGKLIANQVAARTERGNYAVGNRICLSGHEGDSIDEWEEVAAVPTHKLKHLRDMFLGVELHWRQHAAIQEVLTHLPAYKPTPLDQAVTRVLDKSGTMIAKTDPDESKLSLLFDVIAGIACATNKAVPLANLTRICTEWADIENPRRDSLEDAKARAESDPTRAGILTLAAYAGEVAASLNDGMSNDPETPLLEIAHHALSWLAEIIEEEGNDE